jgi:iron(III) transport system permease protein
MNWPLVINSLLVSSLTTLCALALGLAAALCAMTLHNRLRALLAIAAVIALVLPPFLVTNCWIELLGEHGAWRRLTSWNIYGLDGAVWIQTLLSWPISFFFISAAWRRLQNIHLEADPLLRGRALLRWVLLPLARPAIFQSSILTFVLALNNFAVPAILQVKVFPAEIWVRFNTTFDYASAIQLSWPLILAPFLLVMALRRRDTAWNWRADLPTTLAFRRQTGTTTRAFAAALTLFVATMSVGVPLWQLIASPLTWQQFWPALAAGQFAILHSLEFASASATLVIILSLLAWRLPLEPLLWIAFFMPGVLLGIALIWIFNRPGLRPIYQSIAIVLLAYLARYAALGWSVVARSARAADPSLLEAIRLEGATPWQTFRHALWPQIHPAIAAAWYVTYLLCLWDVETLVLIVPPGGESLSLRVFNLLHYGHNPQVNALCLLLTILALLPLLLYQVALKFAKQTNI